MKEINITYLMKGMSRWLELDWPINWITEERKADNGFFFYEFSLNNIIKASIRLYGKIGNELLDWIQDAYLNYLYNNPNNEDFKLDDVIVKESDYIDEVINEVFGEHQHLKDPHTYKKLCHYISTCAYFMFDIHPTSSSFSTKIIEALGYEYIFIAGCSQNAKFRGTTYKNNIYVITHKDNPNLIDYFTDRKFYEYDAKNPYSTIEYLNNYDDDFISIDMSYITVDLIDKINESIADSYNCGDLFEDDN